MRQSEYIRTEVLKAALRDQTYTVRANSTPYAVGDRVMLGTTDLNVYECITAGSSAATPPAFNTAIGATTTDGTVTWIALKQGMPKRPLYVGLFTAAPSDSGGGTEVSGGAYARVAYQPGNTNWSAPSSIGDASNLAAITFPAPTANWGTVVACGIFDRATGGNLMFWGELTEPVTVNNGDPAPSFPIGALHTLPKQNRNPGLRNTLP